MTQFTYFPQGTCSKQIQIEIDDNDVIKNVEFLGGCNGNLQGLSSLLRGMKREEAISRLRGIKCGFKNTSCPDQLSQALMVLEKRK